MATGYLDQEGYQYQRSHRIFGSNQYQENWIKKKKNPSQTPSKVTEAATGYLDQED